MAIFFSAAILLISAVYLGADLKGKISSDGISGFIAYAAFALLSALVVFVNSLLNAQTLTKDTNVFEYADNSSLELERMLENGYILTAAIGFLLLIPVLIISLVGITAKIRRQWRAMPAVFGDNTALSARILSKGSLVCCLAGIIPAAAAVAAACAAALNGAVLYASGIIAYAALALVFGALTFGIGLIVMLVCAPVYLLTFGLNTVLYILPFAAASISAAAVFCTLHTASFIAAAASLRLLYGAGAFSKKKALLYGAAAAIPVINTAFVLHLLKKYAAR